MASAVAGEEEHEGSRRKASLKDPVGRVISATTRADAATLLGELHNQILAGHASFADLAAKHSDYSSARLGGDLAPAVVAPKSAHCTAVASPSARLGQLLHRAVDVGGRRKPRANPYTVAYNRWAGTPVRVDVLGVGDRPRRVRRHLPLHGGLHGRVDCLQVHLQAHVRGRGGRVPGGGDHAPHGAAPKHRHPQRRPRRGRRAPRHGALQGRRAFRQDRLAGPLHRACRRRPHPHGRTIIEVLQESRCATGMVSSIGTLNQRTSYMQTSLRKHSQEDKGWLQLCFVRSICQCGDSTAPLQARNGGIYHAGGRLHCHTMEAIHSRYTFRACFEVLPLHASPTPDVELDRTSELRGVSFTKCYEPAVQIAEAAKAQFHKMKKQGLPTNYKRMPPRSRKNDSRNSSPTPVGCSPRYYSVRAHVASPTPHNDTRWNHLGCLHPAQTGAQQANSLPAGPNHGEKLRTLPNEWNRQVKFEASSRS